MDYSRIGERIKKYREKLKMTQQMLGEETDYSVQHISHIETGKTKLSVQCLLDILQLRDQGIIRGNTWITYRHRLHPFSLPYQTPAELTSGWTDNTLQQHLGLFEARGQAG